MLKKNTKTKKQKKNYILHFAGINFRESVKMEYFAGI